MGRVTLPYPPGGPRVPPPRATTQVRAFRRHDIWGLFWAPLGALLAPCWTLWAPLRVLSGPFWTLFGSFCIRWALSWSVLGYIPVFWRRNPRKHSEMILAIKFLTNFRLQTVFPRPGGGTIAAGNRDSPPGRRHPEGVLTFCTGCTLSAHHLCNIFVFFPGGVHPGSPLTPLIGK